jgi:hypothetical protein
LKAKKTIIAFAAVAVAAIIVVYAAATYSTAPQSKPVDSPFRFSLTATPDNATIIQGGNTTLTLEVTYLSGNAEPITFSAVGGPNGTVFQFTNQSEIVTNLKSFRSNLTISVPELADSEVYNIQLLASATNSSGSQANYNLTVVNSKIQVSGTLTGTYLEFAGYSREDIFPKEIDFTSTTTGETYEVHVKRYGDTEQYPGKVGNYTITLPNLQTYKVYGDFFSLPHYIPVLSRRAQGATQKGLFTLDCGVGVDSVEANFWG